MQTINLEEVYPGISKRAKELGSWAKAIKSMDRGKITGYM